MNSRPKERSGAREHRPGDSALAEERIQAEGVVLMQQLPYFALTNEPEVS
jgi:hypothetical protein